jgi:hypothetical protein
MRPKYLLILSFVLGTGAALAQQGTQGPSPDTKPSGPSAKARLETYLQNNNTNNVQANQQVAVTPKLQASGPLIEPFKPNQTSSTPKRLLNLINPFAPVEPQPARQTSGLSTRSWTSVAGWNPGSSSFPDGVTHESQMSLISVSAKHQ